MVRTLLRYGMFVVVPLFVVVLVVGCQSTGRHGRTGPCSGCNRSHQSAGTGHSQADDGRDHAHP